MSIQVDHLGVKPAIANWVKEFFSNKANIFSFMEEYGSPVNLHNLDMFRQNVEEMTEIFKKFDLHVKIALPRSACHLSRYNEIIGHHGINSIINSPEEITSCNSSHQSTFAYQEKWTDELMYQTVESGLIAILDNENDVERLNEIANRLEIEAKVGLKLSKFISKGNTKSVKAFSPNEAYNLISEKFGLELPYLQFCGFHIQVNEFCIWKKAQAIRHTLVITELLHRRGFKTNYIDIGDVFPVNYVAHQKDWDTLQKNLKKEMKAKAFKKINNGSQRETEEVIQYPYFNKFPKETFFEKILIQPFSAQELLFQAMRSRGIDLITQPKRALFDQTSLCLAIITDVRKTENQYQVTVAMSQDQLNNLQRNYKIEPLCIMKEENEDNKITNGFLFGMNSDTASTETHWKISFPQKPTKGSLICFVNTSGHDFQLRENDAYVKNIYIMEDQKQEWIHEPETSIV
jgi:diaminopimelate decarboxylase